MSRFFSEDENKTVSKQLKQKKQQEGRRSARKEKNTQPRKNTQPKVKRRQQKRHVEKTGIPADDVRKLYKLYLSGPASFQSANRFQFLNKLTMKKIKTYLETKLYFTK